MGMSGGELFTPPSATREVLAALGASEQYFWASLESNALRGEAPHLRDAALSLAIIRAYQTALGSKSKHGPEVTTALLGACHLLSEGH